VVPERQGESHYRRVRLGAYWSHALCLSRAVGQAHPTSPDLRTIREWAVDAQRLYERSVAAQRLYGGSVAGSSPPASPRQDQPVATEDRTEIELFDAYCKKLVLPDTPLGLQDLHVLARLRRVVCVLVAPDLRTSSPTTHVYRLVGRGDMAVRLQELWVADFGGNPAKPPKYDALQYRQVSHLRRDNTGSPRLQPSALNPKSPGQPRPNSASPLFPFLAAHPFQIGDQAPSGVEEVKGGQSATEGQPRTCHPRPTPFSATQPARLVSEITDRAGHLSNHSPPPDSVRGGGIIGTVALVV
jgi:hypothetical protein